MMIALAKEYAAYVGDAVTKASEAQKRLIISEIENKFPGRNVLDIVNQVLYQGLNQNCPLQEELRKDQVEFLDYCRERGFIGISFLEISTKLSESGELRKDVRGLPRWKSITRDNYLHCWKPHHRGFAFLTGAISNMTVIDCDTISSYEKLIRDFPCLADTLTVRTRQGAHIYCQYTPRLENGIESFCSYRKVDIRNDEGLVFAPPTQYFFDGEQVSYEFVDRNKKLVEIPYLLIQDAKVILNTTVTNEEQDPLLSTQKKDYITPHLTCLDDLTAQQAWRVSEVIMPRYTSTFIRGRPVISNGVFEIGHEMENTKSDAICYLKFYEVGRLKWSNVSLENIKERLAPYEKTHRFQLFIVQHLRNGKSIASNRSDEKTNHHHGSIVRETVVAYCLSHPMNHKDSDTLLLGRQLACDGVYMEACSRQGWKVALTGNKEVEMETFGHGYSMTDLVTLVKMKCDLQDGMFDPGAPLDVDTLSKYLKSFPFPKLENMQLFMTLSHL